MRFFSMLPWLSWQKILPLFRISYYNDMQAHVVRVLKTAPTTSNCKDDMEVQVIDHFLKPPMSVRSFYDGSPNFDYVVDNSTFRLF